MRRISRRLERLEAERSELHVNLAGGGRAAELSTAYSRRHHRGIWTLKLGALDAEIARDEARLRALLAGAGGPEAA